MKIDMIFFSNWNLHNDHMMVIIHDDYNKNDMTQATAL